jgi:hypothetical protein
VATKPVTAAPDAPPRGEPVARIVFSGRPACHNHVASLLSLGQDRRRRAAVASHDDFEFFGGVLHSAIWFAAAWGAFPALVGAYAQHRPALLAPVERAPWFLVCATGAVALAMVLAR